MSRKSWIFQALIPCAYLFFIGVACAEDQRAATAVSQLTVPTETVVPPIATTEFMTVLGGSLGLWGLDVGSELNEGMSSTNFRQTG